MTHGDEPSGLGAFKFLLENQSSLHNVELLLVIHNIDGGARWFRAGTVAEKHACRAFGWNFNRLPPDFPAGASDPSALKRLAQLWRLVYPDTTHGLDLHSADQPLCPSGIVLDIAGDGSDIQRLADVMPATGRFRGITELQMKEGSQTKPVGTIFGGPGGEAVALEVESDSHESPVGIQIAVRSVMAMLLKLGCLNVEKAVETVSTQEVYDVLGAVMVPGPGYRFAHEELLKSFASIERGQVLMNGPLGPVRARHSGRLIFAPSQLELQPGDELEEACFELSPPEQRIRTVRLPEAMWTGG
jgi:predicted deacylase